MSERFEVPQDVIAAMDRAILGYEVGKRMENRHKALRAALDAALEAWGVVGERERGPSYKGMSIGAGSDPRWRLVTPWEHQSVVGDGSRSHDLSDGAI